MLKANLRFTLTFAAVIMLFAALSGPASAASPTRVLWNNDNGAISLWSITAPGVYTADNYGPFADWTAQAMAVGPNDGFTRIVWTNNITGAVSLWTITAPGTYTAHTYGPFANWSPNAVSVGGDNLTRLLC